MYVSNLTNSLIRLFPGIKKIFKQKTCFFLVFSAIFLLLGCISATEEAPAPKFLAEKELVQEVQQTCETSTNLNNIRTKMFGTWLAHSSSGSLLTPYLSNANNNCYKVLEAEVKLWNNQGIQKSGLGVTRFLALKLGVKHNIPGAIQALQTIAEASNEPQWMEFLCQSSENSCLGALTKKLTQQINFYGDTGVVLQMDQSNYGKLDTMPTQTFPKAENLDPFPFFKILSLSKTLSSQFTEEHFLLLLQYYGLLDLNIRLNSLEPMINSCRNQMGNCIRAFRKLPNQFAFFSLEILGKTKHVSAKKELQWIAANHKSELIRNRTRGILDQF